MASETIVIKGVVQDGEFVSQVLPSWTEKGVISQTFYSDDQYKVPVFPAAGSKVIYTGSEDNFNFGDLDDGTVDPTTGNYKRASWQLGGITHVKATLQSVTGATHFVVRIQCSN